MRSVTWSADRLFNDYDGTKSRNPHKTHEPPPQNCSAAGGTHVLKQPESLVSSGFRAKKNATVILSKLRWHYGGVGGIRTLGRLLTVTRLPEASHEKSVYNPRILPRNPLYICIIYVHFIDILAGILAKGAPVRNEVGRGPFCIYLSSIFFRRCSICSLSI